MWADVDRAHFTEATLLPHTQNRADTAFGGFFGNQDVEDTSNSLLRLLISKYIYIYINIYISIYIYHV